MADGGALPVRTGPSHFHGYGSKPLQNDSEGLRQCSPERVQDGEREFRILWENFRFSVGCRDSPCEILCAIRDTAFPLCTRSGGGRRVLLRGCRQSVCSSRPFIFLVSA